MVIYGFRIKSLDINEIMNSLNKVRQKIIKITNNEYHRLLSEEIMFLVDRVALNEIKRDPNVSIYDGAIQNVNERINRNETINSSTPYNLRVYVHILSDEEYTYIKLNCQNPIFVKAFDGLEDYSLNEIECEDNHNAKTIVWNKLHKKYKDIEPMVVSLTQEPNIDKSKLKFEDVKLRAEIIARHSITNQLLSMISGGREIPPLRLMEYIDEALQIFSKNEAIQKDYRDKVTKLMRILPDLLEEHSFIFEVPNNMPIEPEN